MFLFVATIILGIIGVLWLIVAPSALKSTETEGVFYNIKKGAIIPLFLAGVLLILSCFTVVGTRNVGVPTNFGKTTGDTYGAGLHLKAPWTSVTDIDGTVQPEEYRGDSCIYVKIADGGTACVTAAYRWRINSDQADVAFKDYRKNKDGVLNGIRKAIVSTNMKAALNDVFGKFDPLQGADINANMTPAQLTALKINVVPDYEQLAKDVKSNVEAKIANLGGLIDIESITISFVDLPESTQNRINAFNAKIQDIKIAVADVAIKAAQAQANAKLADSLNKNPNVLVSKCLDGLISGDIQNQPGFSCFGGSGGVVIPSAR